MSGERILLVDDCAGVLLGTRRLLEGAGYDVDTARDGEEAVARARARRPALVVMDAGLPRMNGAQALREIRRHVDAGGVPALILATGAEAVELGEELEALAAERLAKPVNTAVLLAKVRAALAR